MSRFTSEQTEDNAGKVKEWRMVCSVVPVDAVVGDCAR